MKYTIKNQEIKQEKMADIDFEIREDDGTLIFSGVRPVFFPDPNEIESYIKTTAENIYISHKRLLENEATVAFKNTLNSLVNVEKAVAQKDIDKRVADLEKTIE